MALRTDLYARALRASIYGLWRGEFSFASFVFAMNAAIERNLTVAWQAGAQAAGIEPSALTPTEINALRQVVNQEFTYVIPLAERIMAADKTQGGLLRAQLRTLRLWLNRARQVYEQAKVMAGTDQKYEWVISAQESCPDCLRLAGRVKRLSTWKTAGIHPQHPHLECMRSANGVAVCQCRLLQTKAPLSPGTLPRI